jgi:hypothetical protein
MEVSGLMKRYKFQALVTLGSPQERGPVGVSREEMRRAVLRSRHHQTGCSRFFGALAMRNGEQPPWPEDNPVIVTVVVMCDQPAEYFGIGDRFSFWLGRDVGRGIVTRQLFV